MDLEECQTSANAADRDKMINVSEIQLRIISDMINKGGILYVY